MRHFRTLPGVFDSRAANMNGTVSPIWDEQVDASVARRWAELIAERKGSDLVAIGDKPFPVVSYRRRGAAAATLAWVAASHLRKQVLRKLAPGRR